MECLLDKSSVTKSELSLSNTNFTVSDEIANNVKFKPLDNAVVPLFPTKNGYEYFVFRAAKNIK